MSQIGHVPPRRSRVWLSIYVLSSGRATKRCASVSLFSTLEYSSTIPQLRILPRMRAHHSGRHGQSLPLSPRKNVRRTIIQDSLPSLPDATLAPASVPALMRITNYPAPPPSRAEDQRPDANPRVSVSAEGRSRHFSRKTDPSLSRPCSALHCGRSIPFVAHNDESARRKEQIWLERNI